MVKENSLWLGNGVKGVKEVRERGYNQRAVSRTRNKRVSGHQQHASDA